jgi:MFS transporter, MHS family, proline/betaine transporter
MTTADTLAHSHRPLDRRDYRTLALSALGGALEFYDFIIFVFFAGVIAQIFFPPQIPDWLRQTQAFGIFAAGYLARPLGGIVMAHFGDLLGRKRMFTFSIFLMALPTLAMGLLPTYAGLGIWAPVLLLLLRILQGAAVGGEIPGAWVFVAEHVPPRHIGFACGILTAGLTSGILIGSLVATAINQAWSPAEVAGFAWRLPFLLGGVFGMVAVWLRRFLEETPVFEELRARRQLADELPLKAVLRRHGGQVVLSMLVTWMLTAAVVVIILMTPTLFQRLHGIAPATVLQANSVAVLLLTLGCVGAGLLVDRAGAGPTLAVGSLLLALASYALYAGVAASPGRLLPLYSLAGLSVGVVGVVPYVMVRAFPAAIRFSGLSFSYNVAYAVFGGLTPLVVQLVLRLHPMAPVWYVVATCGIGLLAGAYLIGVERRSPAAAW